MVANIAEAEQKMGGKFGIFTGIVKDFGGDKNKAFAWLQDKQMKEMAAYQRKTGANPQEGSGRKRRKTRRKKRRKSRKSRRRRRGGSTNPAVMALVDIFYKPPPKVAPGKLKSGLGASN